MISRSFTGRILPSFFAHFEQIGRDEFVADKFRIGGGQGGIGAGLVAIDLAIGQHQHPAAAFAIKHVAVAQTVCGQHLEAVILVRHGGGKTTAGRRNQDFNTPQL